MKIYIIAILFISTFSLKVNAQDEDPTKLNIIPPSPEAASLGKFGDIPVGLYTGIPQIGIPIYTIQSRDIQVPISLNYHASGIRVDEEASWVGLGWALQAGGSITRTVRGKNDFSYDYYFQPQIPEFDKENRPTNMLPDGCEVNTVNTTNGQKHLVDLSPYIGRHINANSGLYACDNQDYTYDFEPDQFSFNFAGNSGKFHLSRDREVILENLDKIEITPPSSQTGSWVIKTKDGATYFFEIHETYDDDCIYEEVVTAWYLTKIISSKGNKIEFKYTLDSNWSRPVASVSEYQSFSTDGDCPGIDNSPSKSLSQYKRYQIATLTKIIFDHGEVIFDFDTDRSDLLNGKKLNKIEIYKKDVGGTVISTPLKTFVFTYEYFHGKENTTKQIFGNEDSFLLDRLKLVSVKETYLGEAKQPHIFTYFEEGDNVLPSKGSFARDHWGYYNGALNNDGLLPEFTGKIYTLRIGGALKYTTWNMKFEPGIFDLQTYYHEIPGANREPSANHMKAFSIKEIQYPTGGKTVFNFEPHDYDEEASNINDRTALKAPDVKKHAPVTLMHGLSDIGVVKSKTLDLSDIFVPKDENAGKLELRMTFGSSNGLSELLSYPSNMVYISIHSEDGSQVTIVDPKETNNAKCPTTGLFECSCFVDDPIIPGTEQKNSCVLETFYFLTPGKYIIKTYIDPSVVDHISLITATFNWSEFVDKTDTPISMAGGLRVSEITNVDIDGKVLGYRKYNYHYQTDKDGDGFLETRSYGRRMSKPNYMGYELDFYFFGVHNANVINFILPCMRFSRSSDSVVPLNGSASGSVVGYDKVEVLYGKDGKGRIGIGGKTVVEFENQPDLVTDYFIWRKPGLANLPYFKNGQQLHQTDYRYDFGKFKKVKEVQNQYFTVERNTYFGIRRVAPIYYDPDVLSNADICSIQLFIYPSQESHWTYLSSSIETIYDQFDENKFITNTTTYFYDNPDHRLLTRQISTDSEGKEHVTKILYPLDYTSPSATIQYMIENYQLANPIEKIQMVDGKVISAVGTKFKLEDPLSLGAAPDENLPEKFALPYEIYVLETDQPITDFTASIDGENFNDYTKKATYINFDSKGNVREYSLKDNIHSVYLWGYDYSLPIAKIENATFTEVLNALNVSILELQSLNQIQLENTFTSLREALPQAVVINLSFDPLVGMKSQSDPNGISTFYEYDDLGRLEQIRDKDFLLQSFEYKYYNE